MKYALPLILLTLNFIGSAQASESRRAAIYHCGKDGKELRDSPCPEAPGKDASAVSYDQPAAADARATRERSKTDAQQADSAERQRLAAEARARRESAHAGSLSEAAPAAKPARQQPDRVARAPKLRKAHSPAKAASS